MFNTKILTTLIICIGIIISTWLVNKTLNLPSPATKTATSTENTLSVSPYENSYDSSTTPEWQKILTSVDPKNQTVTIVGGKKVSSDPTETTLTSQMAKDFFAQYLVIQKNKGQVTAEDAKTIANNTLSSPDYTNALGVKYTIQNLHISPLATLDIAKKYNDDLLKSINARYPKKTNVPDVMNTLDEALQKNNPTILNKLDILIIADRGFISDLINITVPKDAVEIHLGLLNAVSNLLSNIEAIREAFSDPVKSFAGASQYTQHEKDTETAMQKLNIYLESKSKLTQ